MWELKDPKPVKLIIGILAADDIALHRAIDALTGRFGPIDRYSDVWPFVQTNYYRRQTGSHILRQFITAEKLIDPGELAEIKLATNRLEESLARSLDRSVPRPVNLDPGILEPSKLILATTKNYSHRIYIGQKIFAEVTLIYDKNRFRSFYYTYPDYQEPHYHDFFKKVRDQLVRQLRETP